jgi:hypothetical protein
MKQKLSILLGVALAATAFGQDSLKHQTITVSTDGPDYYADGSLVLPGETYLLVYVDKDADQDKPFGGVLADKQLVDPTHNRIALECKADKAGGRCGFYAVQYDAAQYAVNGSWALVLLDTRNANGVGGLVVNQSVVTKGVNIKTVKNAMGPEAMDVSGDVLTASVVSKVAKETPTPEIASLDPKDGKATIRIKAISAGAPYDVETTADLASDSWTVPVGGKSVQVKTHGVAGDSELEVEVDADGNAKFFRVVMPDKAN